MKFFGLVIAGLVAGLAICCNTLVGEQSRQEEISQIFFANGYGSYEFRLDGRPNDRDSGYVIRSTNQRAIGIVGYATCSIFYNHDSLLTFDGNTRSSSIRGNYTRDGHHIIFAINYHTPYVFINGKKVNLPESFLGDIRLCEKDGLVILGLARDERNWSFCVFQVDRPDKFELY